MTMVPAQTQTQQQQQQQKKQQQNGFNLYSGFAKNIKNHDAPPATLLNYDNSHNRFGLVEEEAGSGYNHHQYLYYNSNNTTNCIGGSTSNHLLSMADDEDSTTNETGSTSIREPPHLNNTSSNELQAVGEASWLRLGIGATGGRSNTTSPSLNSNTAQRDTGSMLELNLLPATTLLPPPPAAPFLPPPATGFSPVMAAPIMFYQQQQQQIQIQQMQQQAQQRGWANYLTRTPAMPNPTVLSMASSSTGAAAASSFRLVDPPPRPHSGIWFKLQPSVNQVNEPFLPQLPNKYLRIKDGRMTVGLLIKYLVNKLGLESESEVEIRCRGEEVEANLTMQQVRDEIWSAREDQIFTLLPNTSTADHIMLLHYATRSSSSNN